MTFDKPEHKQFLMEILSSQVAIPLSAVEIAAEVKAAVAAAEVAPK